MRVVGGVVENGYAGQVAPPGVLPDGKWWLRCDGAIPYENAGYTEDAGGQDRGHPRVRRLPRLGARAPSARLPLQSHRIPRQADGVQPASAGRLVDVQRLLPRQDGAVPARGLALVAGDRFTRPEARRRKRVTLWEGGPRGKPAVSPVSGKPAVSPVLLAWGEVRARLDLRDIRIRREYALGGDRPLRQRRAGRLELEEAQGRRVAHVVGARPE